MRFSRLSATVAWELMSNPVATLDPADVPAPCSSVRPGDIVADAAGAKIVVAAMVSSPISALLVNIPIFLLC